MYFRIIVYKILKVNILIWNINDNKLLQEMKICKIGQMFVSPCFKIFNCYFCLRYYPNGYDVYMDNNINNTMCVMLNLIAMPPNIDSICIVFELLLKELNIKSLEHQRFQRESFWGSEHKNIDILPLEELTIQCNVNIMDVYDENGKSINLCEYKNNIVKDIEMDSMGFVWNVCDLKYIKLQKKGYIIMSPIFIMFGFKWYMELHP